MVTHSTADYEIVAGRPRRRCWAPLTRGLNRNHNGVLKGEGAATAAKTQPGPLQDWRDGWVVSLTEFRLYDCPVPEDLVPAARCRRRFL